MSDIPQIPDNFQKVTLRQGTVDDRCVICTYLVWHVKNIKEEDGGSFFYNIGMIFTVSNNLLAICCDDVIAGYMLVTFGNVVEILEVFKPWRGRGIATQAIVAWEERNSYSYLSSVISPYIKRIAEKRGYLRISTRTDPSYVKLSPKYPTNLQGEEHLVTIQNYTDKEETVDSLWIGKGYLRKRKYFLSPVYVGFHERNTKINIRIDGKSICFRRIEDVLDFGVEHCVENIFAASYIYV
jgi:hypothetical protein